MKKYTTDMGRTITADSMDAAQAIADQYGMGAIIGTEKKAPKKPDVVRSGNFAAWSGLTQGADFVGTLAGAAHAAYNGYDLDVVFYGTGKPEKLNAAEKRVVLGFFADAE